jgi:ParB family transcriptional regulator, chromosome partitioning protein
MAIEKKRLGRGLSGMLSTPVRVDVPTIISPEVPVVTTIEQRGTPDAAPARGSTAAPNTSSQAPFQRVDDASPRADETQAATPSAAGVLRQLSLSMIVPNRYQPRQNADTANIDRLAESIKSSGLIQPIAVRAIPSAIPGTPCWEIVAGERRWRAAGLAGLDRIPAVITELDDRGAAEWAIVENVQREDLNPMDRAWAFRGLIEHFGMSQQEIAQRVGVDRSTVANIIRLTELEPQIQTLIATGQLSAGHGKALLQAPATEARVAAAMMASQDGWSVRQTEAWASEAAAGKHAPKAPSHQDVSAERAELEKQLSDHLGTRVRVHTNAAGTRGRLVLEFFDLEHFDALMQRLNFKMRS